jgi:rhodanese-related sulfurtransferase
VGIFSRLKSVFSKPYTRVGVTEAKALVASGATVIDVRSTAEWRTGRIPAAKHVPLDRLQASSAGIRKDRPVIAVCQSGARSAIAARQLAERGYDAYSLSGGMGAWRRSGEPTR